MVAPILLLDDEQTIAENIAEYIGFAGILNPLVIRNRADEGLAYLLDTTTPLPVIVLLDLYFPNEPLSGMDVLKVIRSTERTRDICVFILSANVQQENVAMLLGANKFLRKPFKMDDLIAAMNECGVTVKTEG